MTLSATAPRPAGAEPTPAFCEGIQYFNAPWADADRHATAVIAPHQKAVADPADATAGTGVILAEYCHDAGLELPPLPESCRNDVAPYVPAFASLANPLDLTAEIGPDAATFNRVLKRLVMDDQYDQIIARYGAVQAKNAPEWAAELSKIASETDKPLVVAWSRVPDHSAPALRILEESRVPWFVTPTRCVTALAALNDFADKRRREQAFSLLPRDEPPRKDIAFGAGSTTATGA